MKKYINIIILLIIVFVYMLIPVFIYPDSIVYYKNTTIFLGLENFANWDILRGPTLSLVQFPFLLIFGNNEFSLRICTCIFYLIMLLISLKLILVNKSKKISFFLFLVLIMFNPVLYGYYHSLLTEFVATTFSLVSIYFSCKFLDLKMNKKNVLLMILFYSFIFVFMWFLKQPYFTVAFFPCLVVALLKIENKKDILKSVSIIFMPTIVLLLSIIGWKQICISGGINYDSGANSTFYLTSAVVNSNSNIKPQSGSEFYDISYIANNSIIPNNIKEKVLEKLNKNEKNYKLYYVYNIKGDLKDVILFEFAKSQPELSESVNFAIKNLVQYPIISVDSYISNYLASINIYTTKSSNGYCFPYKKYTSFNNENLYIGMAYKNSVNNNYKWLSDTQEEIVSALKVDYDFQENNLINHLARFHYNFYRISYLLLPIIWIVNLFQVIRAKKKYEKIFVMTSFVFLHCVFHAATGAIYDRYIYISLPVYACALITWLNIFIDRKSFSSRKREKNKKGKVLFVIPAYNESKNIEKVLIEIRQDVSYADIIVINDSSKDNTKEIILKNNVKCIDSIFNMKYAMAVQTGIKYAYENGYDYIIQMDADGQHIAKEAARLYETIIKEDVDIVIGSRYLKDLGYKCPFFRRIGTKIFEWLIRLFCNEKIVDPLSGFQCLNKDVIREYATMGKYPEYPDANLVVKMLRQGYKIIEIPVKMRIRENGESMHSGIIKPIKYMINMIYTIFFIVITTPKRKRG